MSSESQNVEYKQSWKDEYLKWICGFANAQGGRIFIGKDDAGKTVGLAGAKKLLEDLPNKIRDHLGLMPHINLLHEGGKAYLEIVIEPSTVPISLRGSYYWRSGSKDPGEFYPNLFVKIGRFGLNMVDMRFQEVCEGNLFQLLRGVMEQLERKFLIKPIRFEGLRRIEELEYPVSALREMLLNALVHRNYMGSMTQLRVMDDRLSLWNAGALPFELTVEKLFQTHRSIPRNPLIAEVCYRVGYIDSWGRGIEKITDACKTAGLPEPIIDENTGGVVVELLKAPTSEELGNQLGNRLGNQLGNQLGNTKARILAEMKANPKISTVHLAALLEISTTAVEKNIKQLREDGLIVRIGGTRGQWEVSDESL